MDCTTNGMESGKYVTCLGACKHPQQAGMTCGERCAGRGASQPRQGRPERPAGGTPPMRRGCACRARSAGWRVAASAPAGRTPGSAPPARPRGGPAPAAAHARARRGGCTLPCPDCARRGGAALPLLCAACLLGTGWAAERRLSECLDGMEGRCAGGAWPAACIAASSTHAQCVPKRAEPSMPCRQPHAHGHH